MLRITYKITLLTILFAAAPLSAEVLITGDGSAATGKTFSFNVSEHAQGSSDTFYVARNDASAGSDVSDAVRQYSLAGVRYGTTGFLALAPAKVYLNGVQDSDNPLIGQKIAHMGLFKNKPLVVRSDADTHLYWVASGDRNIDVEVVEHQNVKDAQGASGSNGSTNGGIMKVAGNNQYAFAAVKPNGGNWGVSGGGIALLQHTGTTLTQLAAVTSDTGTKALGLDNTTAELKIVSNLDKLNTSIVDMHWDETLQRLYISVRAESLGATADGARGVLMAYIESVDNGSGVYENKLKFAPFAPADAFTGTDYIVGGLGSVGVQVFADIQKVRTMHLSTGASYLVTLGNTKNTDANKTVSALPLVNKKPAATAGSLTWITDTSHGALASKTIDAGTNLKEYFTTLGQSSYFAGRAFQTAASVTADLTAQTDAAAQVGGAAAPGVVQDIQIHKDVVFVAVAMADDQVCVYSSQALLDVNGAIKGWTPWRAETRPVTGTHSIFGIGYQGGVGRMLTMQGSAAGTIDTIKSSAWAKESQDGLLGGTTTDASVGFASLLEASFSSEEGGVQGLFDFPKETTAFSQTAGRRLSMMVGTGYKKVVLIETGQDNGSNNFVPHVGSFSHADNITITDGTLDTARTANTKMITLSGGALDTVGAIATATIINETTNGGYLVVGGVGGVAILRATSGGAGWTTTDLRKSFENIGTNKSFAIIGSYSNVRKVVADGQFLYVLTNKTFDRIPAGQLTGSITPTVLATPAGLGLQSFESFSDVLVSSKLALLGTSSGLYRTGNAKDISTETSAANVSWTKISFTEGPTPVTRLFAVSKTALETDFAKQTVGGMVYVLASSVTQELSSVYRLATRDISGSAIASNTVELIPDDIISAVVGPYAHLGNYKNYFSHDGTLGVMSRGHYDDTKAVLQILPKNLAAGGYVVTRHLQSVALQDTQTEVGKMVQSSALGSRIVPTNSDLHILE